MDSLELSVAVGSFAVHFILFELLSGFGSSPDAQKLKACYLSHIHCATTLTSCIAYWLTYPVSLFSPEFMVQGPAGFEMQWMRCTVSFSVGYFANDLVRMIQHSSIGGADMIAHHIIIGGFFLTGLIDRCCTPYHFLFMIEELSTPFLNLRWQYRAEKDSKVYAFCQAAFVILFFICRILIGTGLVWFGGVVVLPSYILAQPSAIRQGHLITQFTACTLSRFLNLYWLWKIYKIAAGGSYKKGHVDEDKVR